MIAIKHKEQNLPIIARKLSLNYAYDLKESIGIYFAARHISFISLFQSQQEYDKFNV